jgi:hypothetical protein
VNPFENCRAVIARPSGDSWRGREVIAHGGIAHTARLIHHLTAVHHAGDTERTARLLIDEHHTWDWLGTPPTGATPTALPTAGDPAGSCHCHPGAPPRCAQDPDEACDTADWPRLLLPGTANAAARYAYLITSGGLGIELHHDGDWHRLGTVPWTLPASRSAAEFQRLAARAREHADYLAFTD